MFRIWVVVAEANRARIFAMKDLRIPLLELADIDNPATSDERRDLGFAEEIAARVEDAGSDDVFDELILVGNGDFLEGVRSALSVQTLKRARCVRDRDLVGLNETELRKNLRRLM